MRRVLVAFLFVLPAALLVLPGALPRTTAVASQSVKDKNKLNSAPTPVLSSDPDQEGEDPDLPKSSGTIDKETYHALRSDFINLLRGVEPGKTFDVTARSKAITQLESQRAAAVSIPASAWTQIGPAPIPNGQTQSVTSPVSGRVTCVAIDPTNSSNVYVGAAQGGLYRSLDGGTTWVAIFDSAQSLAIGALALAPGDPTTLYVGTGEANGSGDSFAGVGLYRINNATTLPLLTGPINPVRNYTDAGGNPQSVAVFSGRSISKILVHPTQPGKLLVGVAGGVIGIGADVPFGGSVSRLGLRGLYRLSNADGLAAGVTVERIAVSTSSAAGGCFDTPCTANRNVNDIVFDPGDPTANTVIVWLNGMNVGGDGGIWRSTNAMASPATSVTFSQTFTTTATTISNGRGSLAIYKQGINPAVVYAASGEPGAGTICGSSSGAIRRSTDGGVTWSAKLPGGGGFCAGQCFYNIGLAVTPGATPATDTIYIAGNIRSPSCAKLLGKSTDGGASTFANLDVGLHADTHVVAIDPSNSSILYHGNDGGIFKSIDGASAWTSLNNTGFHATQFQSIAVHPTDQFFTIGGTQDNGTEFLQSTNVWTRSDGGDGGYALIDQSGGSSLVNVIMYHTYFNQTGSRLTFARSTDSGLSWPAILGCLGASNNGITCTDAVNFYAPMALGPGAPNTVYFGSDRLYRSTNLGTDNIVVSQAPLSAGIPVSSIGIAPQNDNIRIVGQNNGAIFFTTTGSSTLTSLDPVGAGSVLPDKYVARTVIDPTDQTRAYIALGGYMGGATPPLSHVWRVTDLNTTPILSAINTGLPDVPVNALVVDPGNSTNLYAGTDIGVYRSTDSGGSWAPFGSGLPVVAVFDMAIAQPGTAGEILRIATHGRGMWEISLGPTLARVIDTSAKAYDDGRVLIEWQTGYETDNLGFHLYREQDGRRVRITPQIVAGSALMTGPGPSLESGHSYRWSDMPPASHKLKYWIEDIDLSGNSSWTGPVEARRDRGTRRASLRDAAVLSRLGLHNATTNSTGSAPEQRVAVLGRATQTAARVQASLTSQSAIKLGITREGWYRVSQAELSAAGFSPRVDPATLQMFVDGKEIPIIVRPGLAGFEVEFYGVGLDTQTTNRRTYWVADGARPGLRIRSVDGKPGTNAAAGFDCTIERTDKTIYFSNLRNGEAENFFGPVIGREPVDQTLTLKQLSAASSNAAIEVALQGVTRSPHRVSVLLNGVTTGTIEFAGQSRGVARFAIPQSRLREGENSVGLVSQGGERDLSLLDSVRITYRRSLTAEANALRFTARGAQQVTVGGFSNSSIRMMDVTDSDSVREVVSVVKPAGKSGYSITARPPAGESRKLMAFSDSTAAQPASLALNQPSSWRATGNSADLVILTRREFFPSVQPLQKLRLSQGLSVAVVDVDDVYDEFSFGNKSAQAVKDFLLYARNNWRTPPRFVLLVGDGSYDPRNYLGFGEIDLVATKLIDTQFMETASDEWFVDSNDDGTGELAIGRLPVRTPAEASKVISKIVAYDAAPVSQSLLLVSDVNDGYNFEAASEGLRSLLPAGLTIEEIRRGELSPENAKAEFIDAINRGQKIVNYNGHGNASEWRANLLTSADAAALSNGSKLPLFISMTCLNGFFQDVSADSLGEALLKAERGGAIAVWSSSAMTEPSAQALLDREMFRLLFRTSSVTGQSITLGEAINKAKASIVAGDVRRTWILLGDPSMRFR